ncbi:DUF177 domain-containing protein [Flavobacteriaceae bacterium F08102]|nr:DUF177 domain-containing protein [Flavobacteriaceae bacterium F08102]
MKNAYIIPFVGLKNEDHQFEYEINNSFFEVYPYEEILGANANVVLHLNKQETLLELHFSVNGTVEVQCDLSNELYDQPIDSTLDLVVKFGDVFDNDHLEILIIPRDSYEIDVAQYIYEMIVLALPRKKEHPGIKDGTLKSEILDKLKELQPKENINSISSDPRWDKLKELITDKKQKDGTS